MRAEGKLTKLSTMGRGKGSTMSESPRDLIDEETFGADIPDAALEIAASKYWEVGNPFTIAFCSGLDTCPA
jgi:hypothetical protein